MSSGQIDHINGLLMQFSGGDIEAIDELVSPEFFDYLPGPDEPNATEVFRRFASELRAAAPDLEAAITDLSEDDDGTFSGDAVLGGTWTGELWGAPPDGRHYEFRFPLRVRPVGDRYAFEAGLDTPAALAILRSLRLVNPPDQMHLPPPNPVVIDDDLLKLLFTGQVAERSCSHLADVQVVNTHATVCEDCAPDDIWPALRMCLSCGHVGCCDTSTNKHAKAHWEATGHPLIRSIRMNEGWVWCYEDAAIFQKRTLKSIAAMLGESV